MNRAELDVLRMLRAGAFRLHYQPQFWNGSLRRHGYEALLRSRRSGKRLVSPQHMIDCAIAQGLIDELFFWTLKQVLQVLHINPRIPRISLNLNPALLHADVMISVCHLLQRAQIEPGRLVVELTEDLSLAMLPQAVEVLRPLSVLGVAISLDDWPVGQWSSDHLQALRSLPYRQVKLDRSVLSHLEGDLDVLGGILAGLEPLSGVQVVVEGVESRKQISMLSGFSGIHLLQGWALGKAAPL